MSQQRIQLSRRKGWRKPPGAVVVSRPSKWGNPWTVTGYGQDGAVERFRAYLDARRRAAPGWADVVGYPSDEEIGAELGGRGLACWCPLDQPCHADVLLEVAGASAKEVTR